MFSHASGGQPLLTPPYLVLHCEEFAWPTMLPPTPVRSYFKPAKGPHRFTHHPQPSLPESTEGPLAGLFSVALVVIRSRSVCKPVGRSRPQARCPAVSWLAAL
jgi:hypothetical protein